MSLYTRATLATRAVQANHQFRVSGMYPVPTLEEEAELSVKLNEYRKKTAGLEDGRVPAPVVDFLEKTVPNWTIEIQQVQLDMAVCLVDFMQEFNRLPDENGLRREKVLFNFLKRMAQRMKTPMDGPVFMKTKEYLDKNVKGWMTVDSHNDMAIVRYMAGLIAFRGRTPLGC